MCVLRHPPPLNAHRPYIHKQVFDIVNEGLPEYQRYPTADSSSASS